MMAASAAYLALRNAIIIQPGPDHPPPGHPTNPPTLT